jgi:hypothetical protein
VLLSVSARPIEHATGTANRDQATDRTTTARSTRLPVLTHPSRRGRAVSRVVGASQILASLALAHVVLLRGSGRLSDARWYCGWTERPGRDLEAVYAPP